jgi:hypothetical protein
MSKLKEHAELTVKYLERYKGKRNWKGLKKWENHLLESAREALKEAPVNQERISIIVQ